jgi:hypothetical protein
VDRLIAGAASGARGVQGDAAPDPRANRWTTSLRNLGARANMIESNRSIAANRHDAERTDPDPSSSSENDGKSVALLDMAEGAGVLLRSE